MSVPVGYNVCTSGVEGSIGVQCLYQWGPMSVPMGYNACTNGVQFLSVPVGYNVCTSGVQCLSVPVGSNVCTNGVQCLYQCYRCQLITNIETLPYLNTSRARSPPASSTAHCSMPYCEYLRAGSKSVSGSVECRSAADWMFVLHMLI